MRTSLRRGQAFSDQIRNEGGGQRRSLPNEARQPHGQRGNETPENFAANQESSEAPKTARLPMAMGADARASADGAAARAPRGGRGAAPGAAPQAPAAGRGGDALVAARRRRLGGDRFAFTARLCRSIVRRQGNHRSCRTGAASQGGSTMTTATRRCARNGRRARPRPQPPRCGQGRRRARASARRSARRGARRRAARAEVAGRGRAGHHQRRRQPPLPRGRVGQADPDDPRLVADRRAVQASAHGPRPTATG